MNVITSKCLKGLDRVNLCTLPTPLVEAKGLSKALGGPRILIKRDDLNGLAVGGNKARALEFLLAKAKSSGNDVVVAVGPQQSNWLCCLTAASRKCGMDVILFLLKGDNEMQGNLLLFQLLGAEIHLTDIDILDIAEVEGQMANLVHRLRAAGKTPLALNYGPIPSLGMAGYLLLSSEIYEQLGERQISAQHIFLGGGSGCTQAGLVMGKKLLAANYQIHGVMLDLRYSQEQQVKIISREIEEACQTLNIDCCVEPGDICCIDGYIEHHGTTEKGLKAIKMVAETEGIFLDPTYTSKVMAAMIDQIRDGTIGPEETVVFYHSGGIPAIFSHSEELAK
jgi:1-aminocyclopropane-1-carboxylate deaminase/D-cysteine desulfhydrase-like pyridoxal-dependent ACC family enzyme